MYNFYFLHIHIYYIFFYIHFWYFLYIVQSYLLILLNLIRNTCNICGVVKSVLLNWTNLRISALNRYGIIETAARCCSLSFSARVSTYAKRTNLSPLSSCFYSLTCVSKMLPALHIKNDACRVSRGFYLIALVV